MVGRHASDLECPACGQALSVVPDTHPLLFACGNGDVASLGDLVAPLSDLGFEAHVRNWKHRAGLLLALAAQALENGHAFVAADFKDAAARIEARLENLQRLLPTPR